MGFFGFVLWGHHWMPSLQPGDVEVGAIQQCYFHRVTGVACPLCGLTRSSEAFMRMRFRESWRLHPAGSVLCCVILLVAGICVWSALPGRDLGRRQGWLIAALAGAVMVALLASWVARLL